MLCTLTRLASDYGLTSRRARSILGLIRALGGAAIGMLARGDEADGRARRLRERRGDDRAPRGWPSALERDLRRRRRGRDCCASARTRRLGPRRAAECAVGAIRRPRRSGWRILHRQPVRGGQPLDDPSLSVALSADPTAG